MVTINCKSERLITEMPHSLNNEGRPINIIGQSIKSPFIKPGKFLTNAELQSSDFHLKITDFENIAGKKRIIGRGSFGEVYLMKHRLLQKEYAVKVINKEIVIGTPAYNSIKEEASIHKRLIHDNIVRMYANLEDERKLYLVLEYATQGNLFYHIQKHSRISEKDAFYFFMQACSGLYFLHCNSYIHRDIKPENLLLNKEGVLKICDFGWCTKMNGVKYIIYIESRAVAHSNIWPLNYCEIEITTTL
jgi:serine/threonine protein kinase